MFNQTTWTKPDDISRKWYVIDAAGKPLGRVASVVAVYLTGKHKSGFVPNIDMGDFVIVLNVDKVVFTGKKLEYLEKRRFSGYPGGLKRIKIRELMKNSPKRVFLDAVRRMLPKTKLRTHYLRRLKLYVGEKHPHQAQLPKLIEVKDI